MDDLCWSLSDDEIETFTGNLLPDPAPQYPGLTTCPELYLSAAHSEIATSSANGSRYSGAAVQVSAPKRYVCGIEGCTKAYSSRQNRHRHRTNDHGMTASRKTATKIVAITANAPNRERDILIETFSTYYGRMGEEEAIRMMKRSKKLKEQLLPVRKVVEKEISDHTVHAKESHSKFEKQLDDFKSSIPTDNNEARSAFEAVRSMARSANPESIIFLNQFAKLIAAMATHLNDHSDVINPKLKQYRALQRLLDEMLAEEMDELEAASPYRDTLSGMKRKASSFDQDSCSGVDLPLGSMSTSSDDNTLSSR